ncbi:hypothetical protein FB471_5775 [Amycolatopsis cihanbeyliensis]|uniref:Uncharacterized protein n=1 Tax=Amycolatopsis cihanbeyliensis TaxID=1128664 RepID=A0A542DS96_AMYCI|nr:hypothetical protein FB471_5775 [Amycolatopsis cihanbeyliensis]
MSAAARQKTCAGCGQPLTVPQRTNVEPLIDGQVRYVAVHWGCTTHPNRAEGARWSVAAAV